MAKVNDHSFYQYHRAGGWTYDGAEGATDRLKRVALSTDLARARILGCTEHVNSAMATRTAGSVVDRVKSSAISEGVVLLNASHDGTDRSGEIVANQPVVLDYRTGKTVTGINAIWQPDEYVIVGTALDSISEPSSKKIPVRMSTQPPTSGFMLGVTVEAIDLDENGPVRIWLPNEGNPETMSPVTVTARNWYGDLDAGVRVGMEVSGGVIYITVASCVTDS